MVSEPKKKHIFLVPFMFIGMGVGLLLSTWIEDAFIASMFIGMGIGFLLDSLFLVEEKRLSSVKPLKAGSFVLMLLGIFFIF